MDWLIPIIDIELKVPELKAMWTGHKQWRDLRDTKYLDVAVKMTY